MLEQKPYPESVRRVNERHFAVTFLLDTSGSMLGMPIQSLNEGLNGLVSSLQQDENADVIDIAVVTFGDGVKTVMPHTPVSQVGSFSLNAAGWTPMGEGLLKAAEITNQRRRQYDSMGIPAFKPWIFMITDGEPTDSMDAAREELMKLQTKDKLKLWILGIPGYNRGPLEGLTANNLILQLSDFDLVSALNWVNKSIANVSHSTPGETPKMAPLEDNMEVKQLDAL